MTSDDPQSSPAAFAGFLAALAVLAALAALASGCSTTTPLPPTSSPATRPELHHDRDPAADWPAYQTFAFQPRLAVGGGAGAEPAARARGECAGTGGDTRTALASA
jgi:hypothetical protein